MPKLVIKKREPVVAPVGHAKVVGFPISSPGGWLAVDTECTGLDPWGEKGVDRATSPARPFIVSFCNADGDMAFVRFPVNPVTRAICVASNAFDAAAAILEDESIYKVFHNAQYDLHVLNEAGMRVRGEVYDTIIGMHTINPDEPTYKLKVLAKKYLQISDDDQTELRASVLSARRVVQSAQRAKSKGREHDPVMAAYSIAEEPDADYWMGDEKACEKYATIDAYRTAGLHMAQMEELAKNPALASVYARERKLIKVIYEMETRGACIDNERVKSVTKYYEDILSRSKVEIAAETGEGFNPNSPKQMTAEFFGKRGFTPIAYSYDKKKGSHPACQHCKGHGCAVCQDTGKNPKCDADFLESIAISYDENDNLVVKDKLAHALLYNSAAETMLSYAKQYDHFKSYEAGHWVVHPNYRQTGALTGRLSCTKPNLQNVASDDSGKKRVDVDYRLRECFIPRKGHVLLLPDYSQIEVWLLFLRAKAKEPVLALARGGDAHQIVADLIWGHTYDGPRARKCAEIDASKLSKGDKDNLKQYKQSRKRAKNLQFCKIYGGGIGKIASMIGCDVKEAKKFIDDYDKRLPDVRRFMEETVALAKRQGWVCNAYGRRYPIDRNFAYRATNYDIQGSAADLIKNAMINVYDLSQTTRYMGKMHLLLSIHDELMVEVETSLNVPATHKAIAEAMGRDYKFLGAPIPFPIGMKVAKERWSESTETKV